MAEKKVSVRLVSEGGQLVRAEMQGIGRDGKQAFEQIAVGQKSAAASAEVFTRSLDAEASSFQQLRASLDPMYASTKRYEAAQEQVNAAIQKGITTQQEANRVMDLAAQRYLGTTTALAPVGGAADRASGGLKNMGQVAGQLSFQVQDLFVQVASGQSVFMAFAQQAPQAAGAFSMLGGRLGTVIPYVGTFIAIGAAVAPMLLDMGDKAKTAEERVDDLQGAVSRYEAAAAEATMSTEDLREKYGELAEEARAALVSKMEEAAYDARQILSETMNGIGGGFVDELDRLQSDAPGIRGLRERNEASLILQTTFELTKEEALRLKAALDALDAAEGPVQQGQAADALRRMLADAYGTMQDMPPAVAEIYSHLADVVTTSGELSTQMAGSEEAARRLAGLDIASGISSAATEALALANALGISLEKASAIAGVQAQSRFTFTGVGAAPIEGMGNVGLSFDGTAPNYRQVDPFVLPVPDSAIAPTTSSRPQQRSLVAMDNFIWERGQAARDAARAAGSEADKAADEADRKAKQRRDAMLREAEATYERQLSLRESYEKDVRRLDELLAAGAFDGFGGKETYERAFDDLKDGFKEASDEANKARGMFKDTFASIVNGGQDAGDVLEGIADKLAAKFFDQAGGSLYDAIFGGLGAAGGAGAGSGKGGFWGRFASGLLSFDGGGDTPDGPRAGGLDGKGGFLAVLHPGERVHDKTRGPAGAARDSSFSSVTNITIQGNTDERTLASLRSELDARDRRLLQKVPGVVAEDKRRNG